MKKQEFQRNILVQVFKAAAIKIKPEFSMETRHGLLFETNKWCYVKAKITLLVSTNFFDMCVL